MRVKTVLWSLLLSYGLTGLFLLLLAFLLFQFELGEGAAAAGIVFIYVVSLPGRRFCRRQNYA